jgi:hypothetical protein
MPSTKLGVDCNWLILTRNLWSQQRLPCECGYAVKTWFYSTVTSLAAGNLPTELKSVLCRGLQRL